MAFELGIASWFGYEMGLMERVALIARAGFRATSLFLGEEEDMVREGQADGMPGIVRGAGLSLEYVHARFTNSNLLWGDEAQREQYRRESRSVIDYCARHGVATLVMHLTYGRRPPPYRETGAALMLEVAGEARRAGVNIALENVLNNDILDRVLTAAPADKLRFCYDTSHDFLEGQSRGAILQKWGDRLAATHISDARGEREDHLQMGEGDIEWERLAGIFRATGYRGALMLEVERHADGLKPESYLRTAQGRLEQWAGLVANPPL